MGAPQNPPAFPSVETHPSFDMPMHHFGMDLRDRFAGQALTMVKTANMYQEAEGIAVAAYKIADAMLAERAKDDAK